MNRRKFIQAGYACRRKENAAVTFLNAVVVISAIVFIFANFLLVWRS